ACHVQQRQIRLLATQVAAAILRSNDRTRGEYKFPQFVKARPPFLRAERRRQLRAVTTGPSRDPSRGGARENFSRQSNLRRWCGDHETFGRGRAAPDTLPAGEATTKSGDLASALRRRCSRPIGDEAELLGREEILR